MSLKHMAEDYVGRKVGAAVANTRERTEEKLGAGTFWRIILLVLVVGSLFLPSDFAKGTAGYVLPFVVLVALWLSGNIAVRIKYNKPPEFDGMLSQTRGAMLVFGLSFVTGGMKLLLPSAYVLWAIVSTVFAVAAIYVGARAALADAAAAKAENDRKEGLILRIATALGVRGDTLLERLHDREVELKDVQGNGVLVELPEEFWNTLTDEAKVIKSFATFLPEYELDEDDIEPSQGTLVLHPVSTDTHAARQNLRENKVTSDDVEFDFGDSANEVKRVDFAAVTDSSGTDDFGI